MFCGIILNLGELGWAMRAKWWTEHAYKPARQHN